MTDRLAEAVIEFWWSVALATLGVAVPVAGYEFGVKGRKRLGYRVQMDTTASDVVRSVDAGALEQLQKDGRPLADPTLVLLRIENNGWTDIDEHDYAVPSENKVGITVRFPGRKVAGMVVTELSADYLKESFKVGSGLAVRDDTIELPKVPLNRSAHYKVLAALDRAGGHAGAPGHFDDPIVDGGIKGGVGGGAIQETRSRTGTPKRVLALIGFLVVLVVAQLVVFLRSTDAGPLDCAAGRLNVAGSTAFEPILREAAGSYARSCHGASFTFNIRSSLEGLRTLNQAGTTGHADGQVAFSDGEKPDGYPGLVPRPISFFLFTLVVDPGAGVHDLTVDQIRRLYRGEIANWHDIGGAERPVRIVSRNSDSGTRAAFQRRVLAGAREPGSNSDDCTNRDPGSAPGVVRCDRNSTGEVLQAVADTPGAIGYSEVTAAAGRDDLALVRIGGHAATLEDADHGAYPFWETEYGYTWGEPAAGSPAASFLRYLTTQMGADIIRTHGSRPCSDLANPALCRPS